MVMTEPQIGVDPYSGGIEEDPAKLTEEETQAIESVDTLLRQLPVVEPTVLPLIKLYFFNFFYQNESYSEEQVKHLVAKAKHFSEQEREYSDPSNPLPTIGVEIELPKQYLIPEKVRILNALGISNYPRIEDLIVYRFGR
jgi:hypothetical protein